jgi:hypothetical protein
MKKIPYSYMELLHEIWNYPKEFKKAILRNGWNKYHYYWCKEREYQIKWRLINDFLDHPEKYTIEYRLRNETEPQLKLL